MCGKNQHKILNSMAVGAHQNWSPSRKTARFPGSNRALSKFKW